MMESLARKTARVLERERVRLLGSNANVSLRDKNGAPIKTISQSFMVVRKSNLTIGEEYSELEIAEKSFLTDALQMTQEIANQTIEVLFGGLAYNASQTEDAITAARTWKFRLSPIGAKSS